MYIYYISVCTLSHHQYFFHCNLLHNFCTQLLPKPRPSFLSSRFQFAMEASAATTTTTTTAANPNNNYSQDYDHRGPDAKKTFASFLYGFFHCNLLHNFCTQLLPKLRPSFLSSRFQFAMEASAATSSTTTTTAANPNNNYSQDYDVFISHRGPDAKKTFASFLYRRLLSFGLSVFLDQHELERGEDTSPQLERTIKNASVQVAIFSPGYAHSKWCLDELVLMLETLETGSTVIPVFYNIQPSQLRWAQGKDCDDLETIKKKLTLDSQTGKEILRYDSTAIEKWGKALSRVPGISGFELKECNDDEGVLLDKVVECVLKKFKKKRLNVAKFPTGLEEKVKDFEDKMLSPGQHSAKPQLVGIFGIVGLGGVGKTTLAKELFNRKSSDYSRSCFLSDVRENTPSLILLQQQLLKKLTGSNMVIAGIDEGIATLQNHLSSHQCLVVLDDVDNVFQVDALFPIQTVIHSNSLILITSRDIDVLRPRVEELSIYKLTGLNEVHSRQLFCFHSFNQGDPLPGFESLVEDFLKACDGLPLSLMVFGALVYGKDNAYWKEQLNRLEQTLPTEIKKRLKISYDALDTEDKEIFLDIACFFIRHKRDTAIRVWEGSRWKGRLGFQNLQNRCLVTMDSENYIHMHDHLRDLGRDVAQTLKPPRIWQWTEDVIDNLLQQSRIVVRGIKMDTSDCNHGDDLYGDIGMMRLRLLDTEEDILERIVKWVKYPNLMWLRWKKCPHSSLRSWIPMENLRVLQVSGSGLQTLWEEESKAPLQLRELEIYAPLRNIPKSIGQLKHLERIVIGRCLSGRVNLTELPEEFCELQSLKALVLAECSRLKSLPDSFGKLTTLEHIDLSFCCNLESLPDSFCSLSNLQYIDLSNCRDLKSLPRDFCKLRKLKGIELPGCHHLKSLPDSFPNLENLQHISLSDCHGLKSLPDSFGDLKNLQDIDLSKCDNLDRLPESFGCLTNLQQINLSNCHAIKELPDFLDKLKNLQHIDLSSCHNLERLPNSLGSLSKPTYLCLEGCSYLPIETPVKNNTWKWNA